MKATTVTFAALAAVSSVMGSALKPRCSPTEVFPEYEDNNKAISYSSGWTFLVNQGSRDAGGVEAYSGEASAYYTLSAPEAGGTFTINAGKKLDRGYFDVFVNDDYLGRGDAYDATCPSNCASAVVFTGSLANYTTGAKIIVQNRSYDSRLSGKVPYIDLNQITFVPSNC